MIIISIIVANIFDSLRKKGMNKKKGTNVPFFVAVSENK